MGCVLPNINRGTPGERWIYQSVFKNYDNKQSVNMSDVDISVQNRPTESIKKGVKMHGWVIVHVNKTNFHTVYREPVPQTRSWRKLKRVLRLIVNVYRSVN